MLQPYKRTAAYSSLAANPSTAMAHVYYAQPYTNAQYVFATPAWYQPRATTPIPINTGLAPPQWAYEQKTRRSPSRSPTGSLFRRRSRSSEFPPFLLLPL